MGNAQPKPAAAPAAAAAPVQQGRKTDSTDTNPTAGMRVLEPHEVKGDLEDFYDVPESKQQLGRGEWGHYTAHPWLRLECWVQACCMTNTWCCAVQGTTAP